MTPRTEGEPRLASRHDQRPHRGAFSNGVSDYAVAERACRARNRDPNPDIRHEHTPVFYAK